MTSCALIFGSLGCLDASSHTATTVRRAAEVQEMMNAAKMDIILATLKSKNGKCTFATLFDVAEEKHCDVLSAALKSMKKARCFNAMPASGPAPNTLATGCRTK